MPFTLAHPAAAIPLRRILGEYAVFSALVIGSLTPDLSYFLPVHIPRGASHSPAALFWFCLPAGFLVYMVFHAFLKRPLVSLSPAYLRRRLIPVVEPSKGLPAARPIAIALSLFAGATSHILWDALTHSGAPLMRRLGGLTQPLIAVGVHPAFGENTLQLLSTALGFLVLGVFSLRWIRRAAPSPTDQDFTLTPRVRASLLALLLLSWGLLALPRAAPYLRHGLTAVSLQELLARVLTAGSSASVIALILFGAFWQWTEEDRPPRPSGSATQER